MPTELWIRLVIVVGVIVISGCVGSFLNVVIYRVPRGLSVNEPRRSFCPGCGATIPWWRNLPLVSWLQLRGQCAECGVKIPFRYWLVEAMTVVLALLIYQQYVALDGRWALAGVYWLFVVLLVAATFIDLEHYIIPHVITVGGMVAALVASWLVGGMMGMEAGWRAFLWALAGGATGFAGLWLVVQLGQLAFGRVRHRFGEKGESWRLWQPEESEPPVFELGEERHEWWDLFASRRDRLRLRCVGAKIDGRELGAGEMVVGVEEVGWKGEGGEVERLALEDVKELSGRAVEIVQPRVAMGFGDVMFLGMIGCFLGWQSILFTVLAGSVAGTLVALAGRLAGGQLWGRKLPFGPYLAFGALLWLFAGDEIVDWYFGLMRPVEVW